MYCWTNLIHANQDRDKNEKCYAKETKAECQKEAKHVVVRGLLPQQTTTTQHYILHLLKKSDLGPRHLVA